jgi:hypothetical protein
LKGPANESARFNDVPGNVQTRARAHEFSRSREEPRRSIRDDFLSGGGGRKREGKVGDEDEKGEGEQVEETLRETSS